MIVKEGLKCRLRQGNIHIHICGLKSISWTVPLKKRQCELPIKAECWSTPTQATLQRIHHYSEVGMNNGYNVKRVNGKVQHPEQMSQDHNWRVSKKVSDIPVDNFAKKFRTFPPYFQKCWTDSFKSSTNWCTRERTYILRFTILYLRHNFFIPVRQLGRECGAQNWALKSAQEATYTSQFAKKSLF